MNGSLLVLNCYIHECHVMRNNETSSIRTTEASFVFEILA